MIGKKKNTINILAEYTCSAYIITLYLFGDNVHYIFVSKVFFLIFAVLALTKIIMKGTIRIGSYLLITMSFLMYATSTILWAVSKDLAFSKVTTLFQTFILFVLIFNTFCDKKSIEVLLNSMLIAGLLLSAYSLLHYGFNSISSAMINGQRLGGDISQENTFGMQLAFTVVLCIYYWLFNKKVIMLPISILPFFIAMSSGSRKAVLMIIIGIVLLLIFKNGFKKIHKFAISLTIFGFITYFTLQLQIFYTIYHRLEGMMTGFLGGGNEDNSFSLRMFLIDEGVKWFQQNPVFGYGLDNFRVLVIREYGMNYYAHNNYIELLVDLGVIGFILYYSMYTYIFIKLWPYLLRKKAETIIVIIILLLRLIMDYGSVSFDDKVTWIYLVLGFILVAINEKNKYLNNKLEIKICDFSVNKPSDKLFIATNVRTN